MQVFSHGGDVGDLLAALATVKQMGGGRLKLVRRGGVRDSFTPAKVELLRPLLEAQPYISGVEYAVHPCGIDIDKWRKHYNGRLNLADQVASTFGVPHYPRADPWLFCDSPHRVARALFHRSPRYHGNFPWRLAWEKYHHDAVFVGLPHEHQAWQGEFGSIAYHHTPDWWDLCKVIAGCDLFVGNQSGPLWLALGLCKRLICEVCPWTPNCHFDRPNAMYCDNGQIDLPDV